MCIEELRLGLATTATFSIPPTSTVGVQNGATGASDGNASTLNLEQGPVPLLVAPSSRALEDDLTRNFSDPGCNLGDDHRFAYMGIIREGRKVQSRAGGNGDAGQNDSRA